jgi:hypothetical protein
MERDPSGEADVPARRDQVRLVDYLEVQRIRGIVGRYFRIRAQHPGQGISGGVHPPITDPAVFTQLAADVEHSWLLERLLSGEEPMEYDDWKQS